jgi:hypothetical protein
LVAGLFCPVAGWFNVTDSISNGEALAKMRGLFQLVDHGYGVILNRNSALAVGVDQKRSRVLKQHALQGSEIAGQDIAHTLFQLD